MSSCCWGRSSIEMTDIKHTSITVLYSGKLTLKLLSTYFHMLFFYAHSSFAGFFLWFFFSIVVALSISRKVVVLKTWYIKHVSFAFFWELDHVFILSSAPIVAQYRIAMYPMTSSSVTGNLEILKIRLQ